MAAAPPGPRDWLQYQQYADTLWMRVVQSFARDSARRAAGGASGADPLVVGIYGEWGVGKSRLLELMYQLAAEQSARDCALRALDPNAWRSGRALRLTVPVWFHPWKYEHEPHLSVPLLMHVTDAVRSALADAASLRERVESTIRTQARTMALSTRQVGAAVQRGTKLAVSAAGVAHKIAGNTLVRTATGLAAGYFGLGAAAERTLDFVKETSASIAGIDEDEDEPGAGKPKAAAPAKDADARPEAAADPLPRPGVDGRYYYNVQKYLRELARITPEAAKAMGAELEVEVHLNFVVFVDDLDRCLPEKAVEVLEVIKTILNIECFAFVVALDDEVIERGISHRYRDYRFKDAKPEMPITGFEYLEKIVHLPFRLPQLSRRQARQFMADMEAMLLEGDDGSPAAANAERLWFMPRQVEVDDPVTGAPTVNATTQGATPLVDLVLNSFETYVPRKLARTMELVHQVRQVLVRRGIDLKAPAGTTLALVDARLVVFSAMLQLFAPEVFRLLRRRPAAFGQWMRAYVSESPATRRPVLEWRVASGNDPLALEVADTDLYRWAAWGSQAARPLQTDVPNESSSVREAVGPADGNRDEWAKFVRSTDHSPTERHSIEQLRLPLVEVLRNFRDARRHAFAPLSLGAALAYAAQWSYVSVARLDSYLQLFVDPPGLPEPVAAPAAPPAPGVAPASAPAAAMRGIDPLELLELVRSPDAATRASLVERLALKPGEIVGPAGMAGLADGLAGALAGQEGLYLDALAQLAPHLALQELQALDWSRLPPWTLPEAPDATVPLSTLSVAVTEAMRRAELARHGLATALGQTRAVERATEWMSAIVSGQLGTAELRATAGDLLGALGDVRLDRGRLYLAATRAYVLSSPGGLPRQASDSEEPVIGFVRVPMGGFAMGSPVETASVPQPEPVADDFFIARHLVTVDLYAEFVAEGYAQPDLWGRQGQAWLNGTLVMPAAEVASSDARASRPPELRRAPGDWEQQRRFGNRPVVNVTWFEARAFARWLEPQLRALAGPFWPDGYGLRLPTEPQWERAAKAAMISAADNRRWPSGDDPGQAAASANLATTGLGRACSVGLFAGNPIGVCDLAGNAWEWMDNRHDGDFSRIGKGTELNLQRVGEGPAVRGGSFRSGVNEAATTYRRAMYADDFTSSVGVRLVLTRE